MKKSALSQKILDFINQEDLISPRDRLLVGVSGGPDSTALLFILRGLQHRLGVTIQTAHFNHNMRPNAKADQQFVQKISKNLNIPFHTQTFKNPKKLTLSEDTARKHRFDFLIKTAQKIDFNKIALAHTKDDLAETVLMRIIRGTGTYGLRAILPNRKISGITFIRPLLGIEKPELLQYLKQEKIAFRTDLTNRANRYLRNRVRNKLLPLLKRSFNAEIQSILVNYAKQAIDDTDFISQRSVMAFKRLAQMTRNRVHFNKTKFRNEHVAIQRMMIRQAAEQLCKGDDHLEFRHHIGIEKMLSGNTSGSSIDITRQLSAKTTGRDLVIFRK